MAASAHAAPVPADLGQAVADLSDKGCYALVSGAIPAAPGGALPGVAAGEQFMAGLGLRFGINDNIMDGLGAPGSAMISLAMMGSAAFSQGDVVLATGGSQPGCRVMLLADPAVAVTDAVAAQLTAAGWRPIPGMTTERAGLQRRAFFRRDAGGNPYLMNVMTVGTPYPGSRLRLFTTTVRIPPNVTLPEGL